MVRTRSQANWLATNHCFLHHNERTPIFSAPSEASLNMKVRISSKSAASCLLLPSPISFAKNNRSGESLVPLPLQHRTVRRRWLQRRRLRKKFVIRPIISDETMTEDDVGESNDDSTAGKTWELAPESSTDDTEPQEEPKDFSKGSKDISEAPKKTKRSADELEEAAVESNTSKKRARSETKPVGGIAEKMTKLLEAVGKKRRLHWDVTSLVSPMRSSKRQRFSFSP